MFNRIFISQKLIIFLHLRWVSLLRPAPLELPQGGNAARVEGCSGAIKVAYPLFSFQFVGLAISMSATQTKISTSQYLIDKKTFKQQFKC